MIKEGQSRAFQHAYLRDLQVSHQRRLASAIVGGHGHTGEDSSLLGSTEIGSCGSIEIDCRFDCR